MNFLKIIYKRINPALDNFLSQKTVTHSTIKVLHHSTSQYCVTAFIQGFNSKLEKPCGIGWFSLEPGFQATINFTLWSTFLLSVSLTKRQGPQWNIPLLFCQYSITFLSDISSFVFLEYGLIKVFQIVPPSPHDIWG